MNIRTLFCALSMAAVLGLSGCGTTSGAVVGGATGYALGGNTASTAAGAIAGGVIGHEREKH
jgi:outer membrane lipoprotein SlyB